MVSIIGLGSVGAKITEEMGKLGASSVFVIDSRKDSEDLGFHPENGYFFVPYQEKRDDQTKSYAHERYERPYPEIKPLINSLEDDVLFIVSGASDISGASLSILSMMESKKVTILYIRPDLEFLSSIKRLQERVTFNVLQEYARSGLLSSMFIMSNVNIEKLLGAITAKNYYQQLNKMLAYVVHMWYYCSNVDPLIDNIDEHLETSRIGTFGVADFEKSTEKAFYDLDQSKEKTYYFMLNETRLEEDGRLISDIRNYLRDQESRVSYGIYPTDFEQDFVFYIDLTSHIQQ